MSSTSPLQRRRGPLEIEPSPRLQDVVAYTVPRTEAPIDLYLDGNEGPAPPADLLASLAGGDPEVIRRYPDTSALETSLAARFNVEPANIIVTAGADEAIDRLCRALLSPGRSMILPSPCFEMLATYATLAGGDVRRVPWLGGPFPVSAVAEAWDESVALIAVASPNNPTGAVATAADIERLAERCPGSLILVDLAYADFASEDLMLTALSLSNAVVVRTFSKAWGLAGLRVGFAIGPTKVIQWMRTAGAPYPVSSLSLALALRSLALPPEVRRRFVERITCEREALASRLSNLGAAPLTSKANFVLCRFRNALWVRDAMAGLGIAARAFPRNPDLDGYLRITCPGDEALFSRLLASLDAVLAPEAVLFDLDGVLADVSGSYRRAIIETAASFGAAITHADVHAAKTASCSNNDWDLTRRLLAQRGIAAGIEEVRQRFERLYQGTLGCPPLYAAERLIPSRELLARLAARRRLAVVTGRPRADALRFLKAAGIEELFRVCVAMEDAPLKPDPQPVRRALDLLGAHSAWMIGDTPDDVRAARACGVVPIGILPPGADPLVLAPALARAGTARVLNDLSQIEEVLP